MGGQRWRVVGGGDKGGILVRAGFSLESQQLQVRLGTGAVVEEEALEGERLCFRKVSGSGPKTGWVSIRLKDKELLVPEEAEEAGEAEEAADGQSTPPSFVGPGHTLGSVATAGADASSSESPEELRAKAVEAAERRRDSAPHTVRRGFSARLALQAQQAEEDRVRRAKEERAEYERRREEEEKEELAERERREEEEERERRACQVREQGLLAEKRAQEDAKEQERARKAALERARREEEEREHRAREDECARRVQEEAKKQLLERNRKAEIVRKTPRSKLMCATPGCRFAVHFRPELGGYCCIACSEGGEHGPRCEQIPAPPDAIKADVAWSTVGGDRLEDMELEEALQLSMLELEETFQLQAQPTAAPGLTQQASSSSRSLPSRAQEDHPRGLLPLSNSSNTVELPRSGKTQEELDLEEALRLSMMDAFPAGQDDSDEEARELEEAIRLSQTASMAKEPAAADKEPAPKKPPPDPSGVSGGRGKADGDEDEDDDDDDDDELPELVPIEP